MRKTIIEPDWWAGGDADGDDPDDGSGRGGDPVTGDRSGSGSGSGSGGGRPDDRATSGSGGHVSGRGGGALGQAIHRPGGLSVTLSGIRVPGRDVETEARETLSVVRRVICDDLAGELDDVTHLRAYVRDGRLRDGRASLRRVCAQAFEWPAHPSITAVGVADLAEGATLELEAEAFVPGDGWEFDVIERD